MRVLVFTGKGGVGTTTAAAATATLAALRGQRTLVISTDAAHSLGDVFDTRVGAEPTEVDDRLYAQQIDAQRRLEQSWPDLGEPLASALASVVSGQQQTGHPGHAGQVPAGRLHPEEAVVVPGLEELMVLLEIGSQLRSERWDLLVVDGAPTASALRLLALPETVLRYLRRMRPLRPMPMPSETGGERGRSIGAVDRLDAELAQLQSALAGPNTTVRLVLTPESVVVAEARRAYTALALYGYRVDGVLANRLFPRAGADPWRQQWVGAQEVMLAEAEQAFDSTPIYRSPYRPCEPIGLGELAAFAAEAYGAADPFARPDPADLLRLEVDPDTGGYELCFMLPNARSTDLALARKDDQLVVTVGSYRRVVTLPEELRSIEVVGAALCDGRLVVRFQHRPEPAGDSGDQMRGRSRSHGIGPTRMARRAT